MKIEQYFHPCYERGDDPIEYFTIDSLENLMKLEFIKRWIDKPRFIELGRVTRESRGGTEHLIVASTSGPADEGIMWHNVAYILNGSDPKEFDLPLVMELIEEGLSNGSKE